MNQLNSQADWNELKEKLPSSEGLLIFKHSPICPISSAARAQFTAWLNSPECNQNLLIAEIDVISARGLSREIATELSVPHQSPQALFLMSNGSVSWNDSHSGITKNSLQNNCC